MSDFISELTSLINKHSLENGSDTPDFILANYIAECLGAFNRATNNREGWYGHKGLSESLSAGAGATTAHTKPPTHNKSGTLTGEKVQDE